MTAKMLSCFPLCRKTTNKGLRAMLVGRAPDGTRATLSLSSNVLISTMEKYTLGIPSLPLFDSCLGP